MPEPIDRDLGLPLVLRADERYTTRREGIEARHCFSHGDHYDAANTSFGPLVAVNDERLAPGAGYEPHRHSDVEVVTWVHGGVLEHEDSTGHVGIIAPGELQHLSAGAGVTHAERNASAVEPLRFIQMVLRPSRDALGAAPQPPAYHQHGLLGARGLLLHALAVRPGVSLYVALLDTGDAAALPADDPLHVHVTRGRVSLSGVGILAAGDTVRMGATPGVHITGEAPSEVLVWRLRLTA